MVYFPYIFDNAVLVALLNCGKLHTLVTMLHYLLWLLWLNSDSNYETHCCTRARVWVQLSHENGVLSMVTKLNASCSHIE
jgi:hypothetical protein